MGDSVSCTSLENYQVQVRTATHSWIADEPPKNNGDGLGPNPFELLLGGLGSCTAITVVYYAGQAGIPLEKIWVDIEDDLAKSDGKEEYSIRVRIRVRGDLSEKHVERLKRAASRCPVKKVLEHGATIETEIELV